MSSLDYSNLKPDFQNIKEAELEVQTFLLGCLLGSAQIMMLLPHRTAERVYLESFEEFLTQFFEGDHKDFAIWLTNLAQRSPRCNILVGLLVKAHNALCKTYRLVNIQLN